MTLRDLSVEHSRADALEQARSYPEEVVIAAGGAEAINVWEPQVLDDGWKNDVGRGDGSCKAIFLRDTPFTDALLYAEHKRRRSPRPKYVTRAKKNLKPRIPDGVNIDVDTHAGMYMWHELRGMHGVWIETTADGVTASEVKHSMQAHARRCMKGLSSNELDILIEYLCSVMIKPEVQGTTWVDADDAGWGAFAEVARDRETEVVERLIGAGAALADNEFEVQEYPSVHVIKPGQRWLFLDDAAEVSYVPHAGIGFTTVEEFRHTLTAPLPTVEEMTAIELSVSRRVFDLSDLWLVRSCWKDESKTTHAEDSIEVARWMRSRRRAVLEAGEEWKVKNPHGFTTRETASAVSEEDIAADDNWIEVAPSQWMRQKNYVEFQAKIAAYQKLYNKTNEFKLTWTSTSDARPAELSESRLWQWNSQMAASFYLAVDDNIDEAVIGNEFASMQESHRHWQLMTHELERSIKRLGLPRVCKRLVLNGDILADGVTHTAVWETRQEPIPHTAPFSERGQLRVWNADPAHAVELLQRIGIVGELEPELPVNQLWPTRTRCGRIRPLHHDYMSGEHRLQLPDGHMVLHGMTGASDARSAIERLQSMVNTGGLKCIAERRRSGVGVVSMSPRGDIASGIDGGVPCKIGQAPHYGAMVVFGMKPSVLQRRELFFAPCDYGGGKDRYPHFTKYAESIGQGRIWMPPTHATRQQHIDTGISRADNEVYIRHEIPWEEIDTVWVESSLYSEIEQQWEQWLALGLLPSEVRLEEYQADANTLPALVTSRAQAIA